jgi:hypothetical protein
MFRMQSAVTLLDQERASPDRRRITALALALEEIPTRSALVMGGTLPFAEVARLRARGWSVRSALDLASARACLASATFEAVLVFPNVERVGDGVAFVASLKPTASRERSPYAELPMVVLPLDGDTEYALFRSHVDFELLDSRRVSFAEALDR